MHNFNCLRLKFIELIAVRQKIDERDETMTLNTNSCVKFVEVHDRLLHEFQVLLDDYKYAWEAERVTLALPSLEDREIFRDTFFDTTGNIHLIENDYIEDEIATISIDEIATIPTDEIAAIATGEIATDNNDCRRPSHIGMLCGFIFVISALKLFYDHYYK